MSRRRLRAIGSARLTALSAAIGLVAAGLALPGSSLAGHARTFRDAAYATPSVSLSAPANGTVGGEIRASSISATVSDGYRALSGTITFKVFGPRPSAPTACTGGTTVGTATVSGDGSYSPSSGFTPRSAGDFWWYASYSGDGTNNPATSACGSTMPRTVVRTPDTLITGHVNRTVSGPTLSVPLSCHGNVAAGCRSVLTLKTTNPASSLNKVIVGSASASLNAGQSKTVDITLNDTGKQLLAKRGSLETRLSVTEFGQVVARKTVTFEPA
jgi:hypothetical protein